MSNFFGNSNEDNVVRAECLFTGFLMEYNLPLRVNDHVGPLLRKMFPKCEDAKRYGCHVFTFAVDGSGDTSSQLYPVVAT